ncbi:MAG: hypothetical protein GY720_11415 [bacterium]|nr:hypothetical protein [bacterium]
MTSGILLIILSVVFLIVALGFGWQEKRAMAEDVTIYSVEDSIAYVAANLAPDTAQIIKRSDVRRILEWEVRYLQDPGVRAGDGTVIAGGLPSAEFAQGTLETMGFPYDGPHIIEVLDLRAEYLAGIGAIGEPLSADEIAQLELPDS